MRLIWIVGIALPAGLVLLRNYLAGDMFGGEKLLKIQAKTPTKGTPLAATIHTDPQGFKYIEGKEYEDALFGMGFAQCRDRLWQMNFLRALASGRLGELIGPDGVDVDIATRMFGIGSSGQKAAERLDSENLEILEAFSAGINHCAENIKVWPIEFYILWADFEPWTPADVLTIHMLMAMFLSFDWPLELERHRLSEIYNLDLV